jgi:4-hydroxy-tetrahydrodipicolinate synthase
MFTGCGTALVTPFRQDLSLDEIAMRSLVKRQIEAGIDFLCPCGTTGESPTLKRAEHLRVVEITVEESRGRVPVLAGAGGYDTTEVVELVKELKTIGADGILSVTPYYNKPTQEGLYQHYRAIAESTDLPIVLYNVQPRTSVNIETATLLRLAQIPNIIGVKEASGNIGQIVGVVSRVPEGFLVFSGDDAVVIPVIAMGGHGVISVISNEIPGEFTQLTRAALNGDFATARNLHRKFQDLMDVNFVETSPGPVKFAMARMGLLELAYRLPIVPPQPASQKRVEETLEKLGLLAGVRV